MTTRQPLAAHTVTFDGKFFTLWGTTTKLKHYFPTLTVDDAVDPAIVTRQRKGHRRRAYPGDINPVTVTGGPVRVMADGPELRQVTPGRVFTCEKTLVVGPPKQISVSQFTLVGSFSLLHAYAMVNAPFDYVLRSPNGIGKKITKSAAGMAAALANEQQWPSDLQPSL